MKKFIQKKGNEILSLPEKYQSDDELVSIMEQRVSELQEEQFFAKRKLEHEISFLKNLTKERDSTAGTINPGGTRKPENPLKGILNPITWNLDNPLKGIWDLLPNRIRSQWARGLTIPA